MITQHCERSSSLNIIVHCGVVGVGERSGTSRSGVGNGGSGCRCGGWLLDDVKLQKEQSDSSWMWKKEPSGV
ncbi:hypothetical protein RIF29_28313 [Crotalaria pallida]|uniref:Uncharacterized protein n=1 Tax=Crotalaria pallida TaxID=3830 RepID=A0AAN9I6H0_CROPI